MAVPLKVTCECGTVLRADSGETVTCTCGRRYDTAKLAGSRLEAARTVHDRYRHYSRLGILIVVFVTVTAFILQGFVGAGLALPLTCLIWWKGVQPRWKARAAADLKTLPTFTLDAEP